MNTKPINLDSIALRWDTDKSSKWHDYCVQYEFLFSRIRRTATCIFEIGVWTGASILMWRDWFAKAKIVGIDLYLQDAGRCLGDPRIAVEQINATDIEKVSDFSRRHGPFDVVVDDGSHIPDEQISTFMTIWPYVKPGGFYAIEDIGLGYYPSYHPDNPHLTRDYAFKEATRMTDGDPKKKGIDFVFFSGELIVLRKSP